MIPGCSGPSATAQLDILRATLAKTQPLPVRPMSDAEVDYEMLLEQRAEDRADARSGGAA